MGEAEALNEKKLGNEAYKKKEFQTAISHYEKAISLNATELTFHSNLAAVYFEMKDFEKCVASCEKAVEVGRENRADFKLVAKAMSRMGGAYRKMGKLTEAKAILEKALTEHRLPEYKQALSEVEKALKQEIEKAYQDPAIAEEEKNKGNEMFKGGDFAGAVKHYSEAIKRNPTDVKIFSNRAACYTKLMSFDQALKDCDKCIELDATFLKAYLRKGKVLQGMGQHSKAVDVYQKALELDANSSEALEGFRFCTQTLNQSKDPEDVKRRAMADPEVQQILGDPAMQMILEQMQNDPKALSEHMQNPAIAKKIMKLKEVGIISVGYR